MPETLPSMAEIISSGTPTAFAVAVWYMLMKHTRKIERHMERTIEVLAEIRVAVEHFMLPRSHPQAQKHAPKHIQKYRSRDTEET